MFKISVVMPVYNASNYLERSLNSIINQTIDDIEIICVNDGSTDNSLNILKNFSKKYENMKIFTQENSGSGIARNRGIKEANGKYIAFLDADDIFLDDDALKQMYDLACKYEAKMVGANLQYVQKDGKIEENYHPSDFLFTYFSKKEVISPIKYGIPWAFYKNIYERDFLEKNNIKFPNLKRGQDPIFLANVLTNLKEIPVLNIDLYGYNHSASGGVNIKVNTYDKKQDYIQHFIDTFEILENNGFDEILNLYKLEFINYLNFQQNIYDEDIQEIIGRLSILDKYFKDTDYGYLIITLIKNPIKEEENEDYCFIKECLFEESMLENTFIDVYRLKEFAKISNDSIKNDNLLISSFKQLKFIEKYSFEEKRKIFGQVSKMKKEIKYYINSNNLILTSNSWKLTSYLRSLKNKI